MQESLSFLHYLTGSLQQPNDVLKLNVMFLWYRKETEVQRAKQFLRSSKADKPLPKSPSSSPYQNDCYAYVHVFRHKHNLNTRLSNCMLFKCCVSIIRLLHNKQKYSIF